MKLLIFQAQTTKAIYCFNGEQVIVVASISFLKVGKIVKGFPVRILTMVQEVGLNQFYVKFAKYIVISNIESND